MKGQPSVIAKDTAPKVKAPRLKSQNPLDSGNPMKGTKAPSLGKPKSPGRNPFAELTRQGGKL